MLRNCVAMEIYTCWVKKRAKEFQIPYAYKEPMFPVSTTITIKTMREYQEALAKMRREKEALEDKCLKADFENVKLKKQVKDHEKMLYFQDGWLIEKDEKNSSKG